MSSRSLAPRARSRSPAVRRGLAPARPQRLAVALYVLPAFAVYGAFVLWPLLRIAWLSLYQWDGYGTPVYVGLNNYVALATAPGVMVELRHSLTWLAVTLSVPVALGLGLALLLARAPARLAALCRALLIVPLLLPSAVIAVMWKLVYTPLHGLLNSALNALGLSRLVSDWLGDPRLALGALLVAACWASFSLSLLVFGAALAARNPDIYEAAAIDGAGAWARFRHLTVPALRGALPLATVATALCAVPSFDLVSLLTNGGPGYATTTLELDMEGRAFGLGQVGLGAAIACIAALIGLVLTSVALAIARGTASNADGGDGGRSMPRPRRGRGVAGFVLAGVTGLALFPAAWLVAQAGHEGPGGSIAGNVAAVWTGGLGGAFATSLMVALVVTAATVALAVLAAFGLTQMRSRRWRAAGLVVLAIGLFQPAAVLLIPLYALLQWAGLFNTTAGVVLPEIARTLPLAILLLWIALRGLPSELLQAAAVDGAAPRQVLAWIVLPLALPTVAVVAVWAFLSSWNEYLLPTIVLQDDTLQTVPVALGHFIGRIDTEYALIATGAVLASAPLLALYAGGYGVLGLGLRRLRLTPRHER